MVKALQNQSLLDIAVQTSGSLEAVIALAAVNGLSVTDSLEAGMELTEAPAVNRDMAAYYSARNIRPATAVIGEYYGEGIEFWIIEFDFVVS